MHKTTFSLAALAVLVAIAAAACSSATPAAQQPAPSNQQQVAVVQQAPQCQNANACKAPTAQLVQMGCVNKIPYTNVLVDPGTKFEVQDKSGDFHCSDSGQVVDGKTVISCYGKELYSFDLKLSDASCGGGAQLQTGTGQCQEGFGYDASQQCCAPVQASGGSTTIQVNLGGCPLPRIPAP